MDFQLEIQLKSQVVVFHAKRIEAITTIETEDNNQILWLIEDIKNLRFINSLATAAVAHSAGQIIAIKNSWFLVKGEFHNLFHT